ncbi:MAG: hypothetical protein FWH07_08360 [Oscillospiraceae bacterium]|nr:hypothetical protein [Oscillospiraceae bacterium]
MLFSQKDIANDVCFEAITWIRTNENVVRSFGRSLLDMALRTSTNEVVEPSSKIIQFVRGIFRKFEHILDYPSYFKCCREGDLMANGWSGKLPPEPSDYIENYCSKILTDVDGKPTEKFKPDADDIYRKNDNNVFLLRNGEKLAWNHRSVELFKPISCNSLNSSIKHENLIADLQITCGNPAFADYIKLV